MGLWARWPVAVAPGMGRMPISPMGLCLDRGSAGNRRWQCLWRPYCFFCFPVGLRGWLIGAIPASLRLGITAGIGLFLAMIGLQGMGLVVDDPDTLLRLGNLGVRLCC